MAKIKVQNTEVTIITYNDKDYISLTDMVRNMETVSYTHLRAHETGRNLVCRLLLEKKKKKTQKNTFQIIIKKK